MLSSIEKSCPSFIKYDVVVIDDHSSDGTFEWCQSYCSRKSNFKVLQNDGVGKVNGTILGLKSAESEWVKFVDGDDIVDLQGLKETNFECDAFYHNYYEFDLNKRRLVETSSSLAADPKKWNYNLRTIPKAMFICKKKLFSNIAASAFRDFMFEDIFINFVICHGSKNIQKCDGVHYYYRQHSNNFYGGSFRRNKRKVALMGERLESSYNILKSCYPKQNLNATIPTYAQFLQIPNLLNLLKIIRSPYLFAKGIYYYVISRI